MTGGQNPMSKSRWVLWSAAISLAGIGAVYSSLRWGGRSAGTREALLAAMPADASAVLFADFAELRATRFDDLDQQTQKAIAIRVQRSAARSLAEKG